MNEYELIGRLADLDTRLKKLEGVDPQPRTPRPPLSLFGEVANLCDWVENTWMGSHKDKTISVRLALAAEKKRSELRDELIREVVAMHSSVQRRERERCPVCRAIDKLSAYESGDYHNIQINKSEMQFALCQLALKVEREHKKARE